MATVSSRFNRPSSIGIEDAAPLFVTLPGRIADISIFVRVINILGDLTLAKSRALKVNKSL